MLKLNKRAISERTKEYYRQYQKTQMNRVNINLHKEHDKDVYEAIMQAGNGNKQAGVKLIVRQWLRERVKDQ